ncbi:hypothetical protein ACLB2K_068779 [Fragaria x ananassa]
MEVYVDNMLVMSTLTTNHAENLEMAFKVLKEYGMKLNPDKCVFGIQSRKFLGFMSKGTHGKSADPFQAKAGRCAPIYLSVSIAAISSVLIREEWKHEEAIYYVSKRFADAESRYLEIKKLALALVTLARKLKPYFQAHTIMVMTNQPLKQMLWKHEPSGRLIKWVVELGEFDIHYNPRTTVKDQAIADFISEFTHPLFPSNGRNSENTIHHQEIGFNRHMKRLVHQ